MNVFVGVVSTTIQFDVWRPARKSGQKRALLLSERVALVRAPVARRNPWLHVSESQNAAEHFLYEVLCVLHSLLASGRGKSWVPHVAYVEHEFLKKGLKCKPVDVHFL